MGAPVRHKIYVQHCMWRKSTSSLDPMAGTVKVCKNVTKKGGTISGAPPTVFSTKTSNHLRQWVRTKMVYIKLTVISFWTFINLNVSS